MRQSKLNKAINESCKKKTNALVIGNKYFLSSFYDKDGAWVEVVSKSTKPNGVGWHSSVTVKVLEPVGDSNQYGFYNPETIHTVNASNLYINREDASHKAKFPSCYK